MKNLSEIKRVTPAVLLVGLKDENPGTSRMSAEKLLSEVKDSGLSFRDYLTLSVIPHDEQRPQLYKDLNGFEASLAYLNLPFKNDFEQGVFLQAASDTFQKYPGTRAMFPEVIDTMLRWKRNQNMIEQVAPLISQSRTIQGNEMISTVVDDDTAARGSYTIAEFGKIPVRTVRTSQSAVGIFKHGSGIKTSYEFERRASLDIMTPFAARVARELEISKVRAAIGTIINGDGVNGACPVMAISANGGTAVNGTTVKLRTQYEAIMTWLIKAADANHPFDTIVGNLAMYTELLLMFTPTLNGNRSVAEAMASQGAPAINVNIPALGGMVNFAYASSMPANKILGLNKGETLEELVEAGSSISENEKSIQNQSVTYVRTENTGYKLAWADARELLDVAA
jgi:hypothetical protein